MGNFEVPSNVMQVFVPVDEEFEVYIMNDHREEMDEEVQINNASVTEEEEEEVEMMNLKVTMKLMMKYRCIMYLSMKKQKLVEMMNLTVLMKKGVNIESLLRELTSKVNQGGHYSWKLLETPGNSWILLEQHLLLEKHFWKMKISWKTPGNARFVYDPL